MNNADNSNFTLRLKAHSHTARRSTISYDVVQCVNGPVRIETEPEDIIRGKASCFTVGSCAWTRGAVVHTRNAMLHLVRSLVLQCIDSCNSVLINLPTSTIAPLQRVQNTAARLVLGLVRRAHITPALKKLHWLHVCHRITFKLATLMHRIYTPLGLSHISLRSSTFCQH